MTSSSASGLPRRTPMPCQATDSRPRAAGSTASTSRRRRASERRRNIRSTFASHHSRSAPPGRNSPSSTRPRATSAASDAADHRLRQSEPLDHIRDTKWRMRAREARDQVARPRPSPAPAAPRGSRAAAGMPSASRYRAASSTATYRSATGDRDGDRRVAPAAARRSPRRGTRFDPRDRVRRRLRSPISSSRSWTASTVLGRGEPSSRCCSCSSTAAISPASIRVAQLCVADELAQL